MWAEDERFFMLLQNFLLIGGELKSIKMISWSLNATEDHKHSETPDNSVVQQVIILLLLF